MNVLSLFDGMSCGQLALEKVGIEYENYFSSEINKWSIQITQKNFPDTIQLGDIQRWQEWDLPKIDLLMGGSPCQGFSRAGKQLNFDDPRSALFFDFVDILHAVKPKWWLLENVKMKQEWLNIINQYLHGLQPIEIDSALMSAQSRKRLYWTNVPNISQPKDKHIYLKDIIESGEVDRDKSYCIDANYYKGGSLKGYIEKKRRQLVLHQSEKRLMVYDKPERLGEINKDSMGNRVYSVRGKSVSLKALGGGWGAKTGLYKIDIPDGDYIIRKLTPIECERLQTVPDNYTKGVSNTQRYRMLGDGWTVDVIAHIFKNIE